MKVEKPTELFANRQFIYLWLEQIFTQFSYNLINFSLIVSVFKLTHSNLSVGFLLLCFFLPSAIFTNFAGLASDYFHRKKIMILANIVWAVLVFCLASATKSFLAICIISVLIQITDEFFTNANLATVPMVVPQKNLMMANSLFSLTNYLCLILGSLSVGLLIRFISPTAPFLIASCLALLGAFFVSKLHFQQKLTKPPKRKIIIQQVISDLKKGGQFIRSDKTVTTLVAFLVSLSVLQTLVTAIAPGFLENVLRIEAADASFVFILPLGVGLLLAGTFLGRFGKKYRKISLIQRGMILISSSLIFLALIPKSTQIANLTKKTTNFESRLGLSIPLALVITLLGFGGALVFVPANTSFQEKTPEQLRGRTISTYHFISYLCSSVLAFSSGFFADKIGFTPILFFLAFCGIFSGFFSRKILVEAGVLEK